MKLVNIEKNCGFLVVRKPKENFDSEGRGAFPAQAPQLSGIFYGGIDRMPWFDIEEDFYLEKLPEDIHIEFENIRKDNSDFTGINVCRDLDRARCLLDYSNRVQNNNEIIAVYSPKLASIKGTVSIDCSKLQFIGYDIVDLGHWSLLREGVFVFPELFLGWEKYLNRFGLLEVAEKAHDYIDTYKKKSSRSDVEELAPEIYGIDAIKIWKVK